ncbi:hypothetical protein EYF80_010653 [Liparis tanakae]|uniref:Uncharacterized protein n=1 Tax=Liparis tanakae TaxID=230148 RepID=A0A4Z2INB4_9TELE|nr:hypothetical protein EYF80_010653 [Liparis tanakae]
MVLMVFQRGHYDPEGTGSQHRTLLPVVDTAMWPAANHPPPLSQTHASKEITPTIHSRIDVGGEPSTLQQT